MTKKSRLTFAEKTHSEIAAKCKDGVLSFKWITKEEVYTHIEIENIMAMWKILK